MIESGNAPGNTTGNATGNATVQPPKPPIIRFDASYAFSISGIFKMLEIVISLIGFILIQASGDYADVPRGVYYCFVSGMAVCLSSILLLLYFTHIIHATSMIPWFKVELGYCLLWILFYLIAGFLTIGLINGYFNTAGYFAFAAMGAFAMEAFSIVCRIVVRRG